MTLSKFKFVQNDLFRYFLHAKAVAQVKNLMIFDEILIYSRKLIGHPQHCPAGIMKFNDPLLAGAACVFLLPAVVFCTAMAMAFLERLALHNHVDSESQG